MGGTGNHTRSKRGDVVGWSKAAARRQRLWAFSVEGSGLSGAGYALTLTMRDTPATADEFAQLRASYLMRLERAGAIRTHWVVEWQERGTPHMHLAVYFPARLEPSQERYLVSSWTDLAGRFGAESQAQRCDPINGAMGWVKYLTKHATRGVNHYQRQGAPEGWEKTGRLWGNRGQWPTVEPLDYPELSRQQFFRLRRIARAWSIADARKAGDRSRQLYLILAPQRADKTQSHYLGASEWLPETVILRLVDYLEREAAKSADGRTVPNGSEDGRSGTR